MFIGRRRTAALAAAAMACVMVLAGCDSGGAKETEGGRTVVDFWQFKYEDYQQKWFKKQVDKYNASQDKVKVRIQVVPGDTWEQKLKAAQAAGRQPDVSTTAYNGIVPGTREGRFAPLDDLLPAKAMSDIKENVRDYVSVEGKTYAYPFLVEPSTVLYYRTDLVTAAGLDPAKPPTTWAELLTWAKKLTKGKVKGMSIASTEADLGWTSWGLQYNACGHLPISDDWSKARATEPCFEKLAGLYRDLYSQGLVPKQPKVGYGDIAPYGQGDVAMSAGGSFSLGQLKNEFAGMVKKTAVAPFPSVDGDPEKTTATLGGWTMTVDAKSQAKAEAADFIKFLVAGDPAIMTDFFKATGYSKYTTRTSVDEALASDPDATADPFMKVISEQVVPYSKPEAAHPWEVSLALGKAIEAAMKGKQSIPDALKTADKAINEAIKKQSLAGTAPK
ncbi:extracellular solute-binding protein [Streptomyces sp. NPDC050418]|uniref:extracellular solute-binding protein n=1 Tax=Streptomyces sp. NPDC050418 TaxID=3365612 RepID=UPI0037A1A66E